MPLKNRTTKEEIVVTGVLADRISPVSGKRRISLTNGERKSLLKQKNVEKAVALFLDLENNHSWAEIAKELGISVMALKDLTKTDDFMTIYDAYFVDLGHDPRLRATQQAISDLLPRAMTELRRMLIDPEVAAPTRLNIIREIFKYAGIQEPTPAKSDKAELAEFLKGMEVNVENVNVSLAPPPKRPDTIDAEFQPLVSEVVPNEN